MNPVFTLLLVICICSQAFSQTTQTRWYVRADASPVGADASSWATATPYLQDAIDAAQPGDSIWIGQGVYKPTAGTNRYATYTLKNGIRLYGGFAGTESQLEQRNWAAHPTILSGDIGVPGDSTDNSFGILFVTKTGPGTRVDGLIFEFGNAGNPDNVNVFPRQRTHSGSAIYIDGLGSGNFARLDIANCTFRRNRSDFYGAIFANGSDGGQIAVTVDNCLFERNYAYGRGGALVVESFTPQTEPLAITNSIFQENYAFTEGGAVHIEYGRDIFFTDCLFQKNTVQLSGGSAVSLAAFELFNTIRFSGCRLVANRTISLGGTGAISYTALSSKTSLQFFNTWFEKQDAILGACLYIFSSGNDPTDLSFKQCGFVENGGGGGSVLVFHDDSQKARTSFENCLFYQNQHPEFYQASGQIDTVQIVNSILIKSTISGSNTNGPKLALRYSLVNTPDCAALGPIALCDTTVLFSSAPLFADPSSGDFHLNPCSPAVNAGSNDLAAGLHTDLDGQPRIQAGKVDLGPYEHDLGFAPVNITPASCSDARDGAITFGNTGCAPVFIAWSLGGTFGTQTDSLLPGSYTFSFIDAAGHYLLDTIVVPQLPAPTLSPNVAPPVCHGESTGVAGVDISGGTGPFQINWEDGSSGSFRFNVPAGLYPVTVTDALGCPSTISIEVPETPQVEVYYTVANASGPATPDGAIHIDSVLGCMGVYTWTGPQKLNLLPGNHTVTVTDPCGCFFLFTVQVGFTVGTETAGDAAPVFRLAPNPVSTGQPVVLSWANTGTFESLWLADALGRVISRLPVGLGQESLAFQAPSTPGVYWVLLRGPGAVLKFVVR